MATQKVNPRLALLVAAVALIVFVVGCSGGSSSSSSTPGSSSTEDPSSEASAAFLQPKNANNKYVTFGSESSPAQRAAASSVLSKNLKAREEADFATQCATLNSAAVKSVVEPKKKKATARPKPCAKALEKLAQPLPDSEVVRFDTLGGPIAALRIEGKKAYALYHGTDHKDYAMPMEQEDGQWKVGALLAINLG